MKVKEISLDKNNLIKKSLFLDISEIKENILKIDDGLELFIFDSGKISDKKIYLGENTNVFIYAYLKENINYNLEIYQQKENRVLNSYFFLDGIGKANIKSFVKTNNIISNINILCFLRDDYKLKLDGNLFIDKSLNSICGSVKQEALILGENVKFEATPGLRVSSKGVKASHSLKLEKINDEVLFYLTSRGISLEKAKSMILQSKLANLFYCLKYQNREFYNRLFEKF